MQTASKSSGSGRGGGKLELCVVRFWLHWFEDWRRPIIVQHRLHERFCWCVFRHNWRGNCCACNVRSICPLRTSLHCTCLISGPATSPFCRCLLLGRPASLPASGGHTSLPTKKYCVTHWVIASTTVGNCRSRTNEIVPTVTVKGLSDWRSVERPMCSFFFLSSVTHYLDR